MIFLFSSQNADESGKLSQGVLHRFILWLLPDFVTKDPDTVDFLEFLLRKAAHMTEYAILGSLIFIQISLYRVFSAQWKRIATALCLTACYACTDEFHQLFVPGRAGQIVDVCIDSCGGIIGILLTLAIMRLSVYFSYKNLKNAIMRVMYRN